MRTGAVIPSPQGRTSNVRLGGAAGRASTLPSALPVAAPSPCALPEPTAAATAAADPFDPEGGSSAGGGLSTERVVGPPVSGGRGALVVGRAAGGLSTNCTMPAAS